MTPWANQPELISEFYNWLISPDAKSVPPRQAKQTVNQVLKIWEAVTSGSFVLSLLFDKKFILSNWLREFEITRQPATTKAYITSLRHFFYFVINFDPNDVGVDLKRKCNSLVITCTNWICVYRKKQKKSRWENDLRQLPQLFTAEDMKKLDASEVVKSSKATLKRAIIMRAPRMQEFTNARDYILMYLCLDNASRTGAIANMTIKQFGAATLDGDSHRIMVIDHKTINTAGPACIVVQEELMKEFREYFLIRNKLADVGTRRGDPVFISWTGSKMNSSMVTAQISSFWGKAVGHSSVRPRISGALVRKSTVSKIYENNRHLSGDLAGLMCHSEDTAKRVYALQDKSRKAVETSAAVRRIMREPSGMFKYT